MVDVLVAACVSESGDGGLFAIDGDRAVRLDRLALAAMAVTPDRLYRAVRAGTTDDATGELLVTDASGVLSYHRLDEVSDLHDLLVVPEGVLATSTGTNSVVLIHPSGRTTTRWQAPGQGDAWHLNSLVSHHGRSLVCAFGRFEGHRAWAGKLDDGRFAATGQGVMLDIDTGEVVLSGLSMPHDPRPVGDGWLICESAEGSLVELDATGAPLRRTDLGGFTRGLVVGDELVHVGVSSNRNLQGNDKTNAEVVTLRRDDLSVVSRVQIPAEEVGTLAMVGADLLDGVEMGLRTNAERVRVQSRWRLFDLLGVDADQLWSRGDPLPDRHRRASLEVPPPPSRVEAGSTISLSCTITNTSDVQLGSHPPCPVRIGTVWSDANGEPRADTGASRADLPRPLAPGESTTLHVRTAAPPVATSATLVVGVLQEEVAWFSATDPTAEHRFEIAVEEPGDGGGSVP